MKVEGGRRYCLLLAARDSDYVKKMYGGYYNVFVEAFGEEGDRWDSFRVVDGEFPDMNQLHKYDGFVIGGSAYNSYGNDYWILKLCFLLQTADAMGKKILGICFGHQVLCRSLGGKVGKSETGWDIRVRKVKILEELLPCSLFEGLEQIPSSLPVMKCHQDEVWEVPLGAEVIGFSDKTNVEMFILGDHIMGIQGHPEYTKDIVYNFLDRLVNNNEMEREYAEQAKSKLQKAPDQDRKSWGIICKNFLKGR